MNDEFSAAAIEITVVITTYGRPVLLQKMLRSFELARVFAEKQRDLQFNFRILLNGDDAESEKILLGSVPFEKINTPITPAAARNLLLEKTKNNNQRNWVVFLDDDIQLSNDFFTNFKKLSDEHPKIDVWGGPNTTPSSSSYQQSRNGWMLASHYITGPIANRYAKKGKFFSEGNQFNLTLCNLFIRGKCLQRPIFLPFLKTAEENELIYLLKENGCKLAASDLLCVSHERRDNVQNFLKQIFYYGYGRGQLFFNVPISKQLIFVLAPIAACAMLIGTFFYPLLLLLWILVINLSYFFKFKKLDPMVVILPPAIWIFYVTGLVNGAYANVQLLLKKIKSEPTQEISRRVSTEFKIDSTQ